MCNKNEEQGKKVKMVVLEKDNFLLNEFLAASESNDKDKQMSLIHENAK